jgi:hypothetical protein
MRITLARRTKPFLLTNNSVPLIEEKRTYVRTALLREVFTLTHMPCTFHEELPSRNERQVRVLE